MYSLRSPVRIVEGIHDFEHKLQTLSSEIEEKELSVVDNEFIEGLEGLLQTLRTILKSIMDVDFNIHIKVLYPLSKKGCFGVRVLGYRIPSKRESDLLHKDTDNMPERANYEYFVNPIYKRDEPKLIGEVKRYINTPDTWMNIEDINEEGEKETILLRRNFAYDYVLGGLEF